MATQCTKAPIMEPIGAEAPGVLVEPGILVCPPCLPSTEDIRAQVARLLASASFKNSRRHKQLLSYLTEKALAGNHSEIKERLIGVEVFDRHTDYDLSIDAVVRGAAVELRKRLAQYYADFGHAEELRVELPVGTYVLKFHQPERLGIPPGSISAAVPCATLPSPQPPSETAAPQRRKAGLAFPALLSLSCLCGVLLLGACFWRFVRTPGSRALETFWAPLFQQNERLLVCVGSLNGTMQEPVVENDTWQHATKTRNHLDANVGASLLQVGRMMGARKASATFRLSDLTELSDLRQQPVLFIGGLNNVWSQRILADSRFQLKISPDGAYGTITDRLGQAPSTWKMNFHAPVSSITRDYSLITRMEDPLTGQPVVLLSGLGSYGNSAATEFITNPAYFSQFAKVAPEGWQNRTLQMVLETIVVNGRVGVQNWSPSPSNRNTDALRERSFTTPKRAGQLMRIQRSQ